MKEKEKLVISWPKADFTKEGNPVLKTNRITSLSLHILIVWIARHVVRDDYKTTQLFGGIDNGETYDFWFTEQLHFDRIGPFLKEIKENGYPRSHLSEM